MSLPAPPATPAPPAELAPDPSRWREVPPRPARRVPGALVVLAAMVLAGALAWFASPWWATWRLVQDARADDAPAFARRVDWPAVRASLKPQLQARVDAALARERAAQAAPSAPHDWWTRLTQAFSRPAAAVVARTQVEVAVTPEMVAQTVREARAPPIGLPGRPPPPAPFTPGDVRPTRQGYAGTLFDPDLDQFTAVVRSRARPHDAVTVRLIRRGLFNWKLAAVDLASPPPR